MTPSQPAADRQPLSPNLKNPSPRLLVFRARLLLTDKSPVTDLPPSPQIVAETPMPGAVVTVSFQTGTSSYRFYGIND